MDAIDEELKEGERVILIDVERNTMGGGARRGMERSEDEDDW